MHLNLWFNTGSELQATVSSRVNRLETFTFMGFANQNLNQISSNPPQEQDDGSVAKTTDWDPRDLKVKSKCAGSFRLNFRPAWALRKPPIGKPSPVLTFIQCGEVVDSLMEQHPIQRSLEIQRTHSKETRTPAVKGRGAQPNAYSGGVHPCAFQKEKKKNPCE